MTNTRVRYLRRPFRREPDFGATSVNYDFADLLARSRGADVTTEAPSVVVKKKLIEVALPLDAINAASKREKSIRHGHPSTLHLWWARRPLAAARAVIFAQMVDDPSANPDLFPTERAAGARAAVPVSHHRRPGDSGRTPQTRKCSSEHAMRSGSPGAAPAPKTPTIPRAK